MSTEPAPAPAADPFAELDQLRRQDAGRERSTRVWQVVGRAYGRPACAVLVDYALEQGLVHACEDAGPGTHRGKASRYPVWVNPVDGSEMVWIPAGPFFIGPTRDRRQAVSKGFSLARHPVTNAQFARFLDETGYTPPPGHPNGETFLFHWAGGAPPERLKNHPVVWVSYLDALAYGAWAGVTLPTEWLWEKAARGPDGPPFPWGEQSPLPRRFGGGELANVRSGGTVPVGSFPRTRTAYGCEDMIGNVSEWCRMIEGDDYGLLPQQRPDAGVPLGPTPVHAAVRGSCFLRSNRDRMPAWHRRRLSVTRRNQWVGFRPACLLPCFPA